MTIQKAARPEDFFNEIGGKRSPRMTATLGQNTGGHLCRRLPRPVDKVFLRFYVTFAENVAHIHHFELPEKA